MSKVTVHTGGLKEFSYESKDEELGDTQYTQDFKDGLRELRARRKRNQARALIVIAVIIAIICVYAILTTLFG